MPAAVLEVRLGDRSRCPEVLRHRALELVVRAVEVVTDCRWVLLYVRRWLEAPLQRPDGTLVQRDKGTPQGSAVRSGRLQWLQCGRLKWLHFASGVVGVDVA